MMEPFVEGRLELVGAGEVVVRFLQPRQEDVDFRCEYQIDWPDHQRCFYGFGIDSVQALMSAMMNAHADLLYSDEGRSGPLLWLGGRDLGLPLAETDGPQGAK